jgi:hypothetical protein
MIHRIGGIALFAAGLIIGAAGVSTVAPPASALVGATSGASTLPFPFVPCAPGPQCRNVFPDDIPTPTSQPTTRPGPVGMPGPVGNDIGNVYFTGNRNRDVVVLTLYDTTSKMMQSVFFNPNERHAALTCPLKAMSYCGGP